CGEQVPTGAWCPEKRPRSKGHCIFARGGIIQRSRHSDRGSADRLARLGSMAMKALLGTLLLLSTATVNAETAVEAIAAHKHMGVATCSNSVCHGASQPFRESNVMQNEFAIWQEFDPHEKTYS